VAFVPKEWWQTTRAELELFIFASLSRLTYDLYQLSDVATAAIVYESPVRMYLGSRRSRRLWSTTTRRLSAAVWSSDAVDGALLSKCGSVYRDAIRRVTGSFSRADGDMLSLLFLEEQLAGLRLVTRRGEAAL